MDKGDGDSQRPRTPAQAGRLFSAITAREVKPDPDDSSVIGAYRILRRVGEGGGGEVFEVARPGSEARFALKLFRYGDPKSRQFKRASREIDTLSEVKLHSMPRVIEHDTWRGRLYVVTEFIDGEHLDRACEIQGLDRRARVRLLARIARIVQSLHEHAVIHRDIKPSNVLVDLRGDPWLIDLGVAYLLSPEPGQTITIQDMSIGTPGYMAPEQARGDRAAISTRTDVYGLGALAWLILTGRTPLGLRDATLGEAIRTFETSATPDPRIAMPELDRSLSAILCKAVMIRPEDRYESAAALADDLERWCRGERVEARRVGPWVRATEWMGRHPVMSTSGVFLTLIAAILLGVVGFLSWAGSRPGWIAVDEMRSRAVLYDRSGEQMAEWGSGVQGDIICAELVEHDGQLMVLLALNQRVDSPHSAKLVALDATSPTRVLWERGVGGVDIERSPWPLPSFSFRCRSAVVADVLPGEGVEIIAAHLHSRKSPSALRIYSLDGDVLWEAWHDGQIRSIRWIESTGQIAFTAWNSVCPPGQEPGLVGKTSWAPHVFGVVTPVPHAKPRMQQIRTPRDERGSILPDYYATLLPLDLSIPLDFDRFTLDPPYAGINPDREARLQFSSTDRGGITWSVEFRPEGVLIGEPEANDPYKMNFEEGRLPAPASLRLGPLPPCASASEDSTS